MKSRLYGLVAEFESHEALLAAAREASAAGYRRMDGFTPFPVEGLPEALGRKRSRMPAFFLAGGILGGAGAYFMEWYANVVSYPLDIGGRPLHSWPAFIPITFELTVLGAALSGFFGSFFLNGLPRLHHPVFAVPGFERASVDRFFLCIEAADPRFDPVGVRRFLEGLHPIRIEEA